MKICRLRLYIMCGICGELTFDGMTPSSEAVHRMSQALAPRGPDAHGFTAKNHVAFGHRRLKIIDLSDASSQPMQDPDLGLSIVFNGCIYNYQELRSELGELGYRFFSNGDTEVILKAFHAWGDACVHRLHGMFAFAIHEEQSGRVTLARDRFGIKPLYFSQTAHRLRFASSLPALLAAGDVNTEIDPVGLHHYMHWHAVVPAPYTILRGVRKLPPASLMVIEANGTHETRQWWKLDVGATPPDPAMTEQDWQQELLAALRLAVKRRMVADVPVGVLLSGGLDSSLIVGLLAEMGQSNLNTFSVGFEAAGGEKGDEFEYSDIVATHFSTQHHKIMVDSDRLLENLPATIGAMSEPMVSHDNVGFFLLSQEVAKHLKVVQSGQGADEIFAGYHWYPPMVGTDDPVDTYANAFFDRDPTEYQASVHARFHGANHSRDFVANHFATPGALDGVDKALRLDATVMLVDDPVKRVDNMTMAAGLEARVPFLDHELAELAGHMPAELKLRHEGKGILKDVARQVIPSAVIDRPKGYFPVPALKYISGPYLDLVRDALHSQAARDRNLFKPDYVSTLLDAPQEHLTPLRGSKIWQVALLELWLQQQGVA